MTADTALAPTGGYRLPRSTAEALLHIVVAIALTIFAVSSFAISTAFGVAATFVVTFITAAALPAAIPFAVALSFMFQNVVVAWYTPIITDNTTFDALRGANFIILMTAFAAFLAASFQARVRGIAPLRPWLIGSILLTGVVVIYLGLGAARGEFKDAVVYFRNIVTPVACFYIAIVATSIYRVNLSKTLLWLAAAAIIYGYCELLFTLDFLSLFHGDLYIERDITWQINTGVWEKTLQETGFVLRGLQDILTTNFFNLPMFGDLRVFRLNGPNFHSISYAYALSVVAVWLLFNKRWLLPLLALPLLVVIGSKGATFMLLLALIVRIAVPLVGARIAVLLSLLISAGWVAGAIFIGMRSGDYHVLGLFAGLRDFLHDPLGQGLGFGGNLSSTTLNVDWERAQSTGAADTPMESAVGVLLYQMGIASIAFFAFLALLARTAWRSYVASGDMSILFGFVVITAISANAVLQEEAYFSPLALGLALLLTGVSLANHWTATGRRLGQ